MGRHVALMRGVNVGGRNRVSMPALRAVWEEAGHREVETYIQSGNVLFRPAAPAPPGDLAAALEAAVRAGLGLEVRVAVRTAAQLSGVVAALPFGGDDPAHLHVAFLEDSPGRSLDGLAPDAAGGERFVVAGTEIFLCLPNGMGRARLPGILERRLAGPMTVRNWNTVTRLAELAGM